MAHYVVYSPELDGKYYEMKVIKIAPFLAASFSVIILSGWLIRIFFEGKVEPFVLLNLTNVFMLYIVINKQQIKTKCC